MQGSGTKSGCRKDETSSISLSNSWGVESYRFTLWQSSFQKKLKVFSSHPKQEGLSLIFANLSYVITYEWKNCNILQYYRLIDSWPLTLPLEAVNIKTQLASANPHPCSHLQALSMVSFASFLGQVILPSTWRLSWWIYLPLIWFEYPWQNNVMVFKRCVQSAIAQDGSRESSHPYMYPFSFIIS